MSEEKTPPTVATKPAPPSTTAPRSDEGQIVEQKYVDPRTGAVKTTRVKILRRAGLRRDT